MVSHWFDPGASGESYSATIRLTGHRIGIDGKPRQRDTFEQEETVADIVPGSGRMSISTWVYGLEPGDWIVTAVMTRPQGHIVGRPHLDRWRRPIETLPRARWTWRRWALSSAPDSAVQTRWSLPAPLARIPAVVPGSFPALGTLGILVALVTQVAIAAVEQLPIGSSLLVSVLALIAGLIAAKVWYAILHPGPWRQSLLGGWSVDGFLVVAPAVAISALLVLNLPIGAFLDAVTPGMFIAVAIGRFGCFFTGCCAGRCTRSRWGVWSSDRRVGARRIPAQLLESLTGLLLGSTAALVVVSNVSRTPGLVFVAAIVVYVVARQFLLRLRAERREYSWRRSGHAARERS